MNRVAESLENAFPEIGAVAPLTRIGEGFSSLVVETAGAIVFRIGKNRFSAEGFAKEARLLPALADYLDWNTEKKGTHKHKDSQDD